MANVRIENLHGIIKRDDIRGKYPDDLDEETACDIGRAIVRTVFSGMHPRVAVGWDARLSSPSLSSALMRGLAGEGATVYALGQCSTELVYFAVGDNKAMDGGVMVTASHNPKDQNGFKIVKRGAEPTSSADLERIRAEVALLVGEAPAARLDLVQDYAAKVIEVSGVRTASSKTLKVVVEAGNGMGGVIFEQVARRLPFLKVAYSNKEPDGNYPVRLPNPLDPEYMRLVQERVLAEKADLGLAFDGDADRAGAADNQGDVLTAAEIMAIIAERFLQPGRTDRKIMHNLVTSSLVEATTKEQGGIPWTTPVGHGQIKLRMRQPGHGDCMFAGEHSGHYFFRDFFQADSGMIAALMLVEAAMAAKEAKSSLHAKVAEWRMRYFAPPETNFNIRLPKRNRDISEAEERGLMQECVERVRTAYAGRARAVTEYAPGDPVKPANKVDTLKMELAENFGNWWFCVRPSGNEPKLRLVMEVVLDSEQVGKADGQSLLDQRFGQLVKLIDPKSEYR